jgi:hypothetical protein
MPVRINKKNKQILVGKDLEKNLIYPFVTNVIITNNTVPGFVQNKSSKDYGQMCGFLTLPNITELNGIVRLQQTVFYNANSVNQTQKFYGILLIKSYYLGNNGTIVYNNSEIYEERNYKNSYIPITFNLNRVKVDTDSVGNNLVGLFIYAYKENTTIDVKLDLAYFEQSILI